MESWLSNEFMLIINNRRLNVMLKDTSAGKSSTELYTGASFTEMEASSSHAVCTPEQTFVVQV